MYAGEGVCALEPNEGIGEVRLVRATIRNIGVGGESLKYILRVWPRVSEIIIGRPQSTSIEQL